MIAALGGTEIPDRIHIFVLDEGLGQVLAVAGHDVDHAARNVRGIEHLIEIRGAERILRAGDHHHRVAARDGRRHQGDKAQQREFIRAGDADHAHRFIHTDGDAAQCGFLHRAAVLIGPARISEEPFNGSIHLGLRGFVRATGHLYYAPDELGIAHIQIFSDEVQDLRTVETVTHGPAGLGQMSGMRRLDRLAHVLAVAVADLAHDLTLCTQYGHRIGAIRAYLFPADIHLGRAVHTRQVMSIHMFSGWQAG